MKRSAGILPYKIVDKKIYVYLEHPGGPYWQGINKWSICKGEKRYKEKACMTAIREFCEESGTLIDREELDYLVSNKVSNDKLVILFIANVDIDPTKMTSNTFKKEFPKGSGIICEFPEMDEANWFLIDDAYDVIFDNQVFFLRRLYDKLRSSL